jgi:hypothetical protein
MYQAKVSRLGKGRKRKLSGGVMFDNRAWWVQNKVDGAVERGPAGGGYGWNGGRFWRQGLSFSASNSQVLIFSL